jgi:hypothetical protein
MNYVPISEPITCKKECWITLSPVREISHLEDGRSQLPLRHAGYMRRKDWVRDCLECRIWMLSRKKGTI